jgi:hypothetical protein
MLDFIFILREGGSSVLIFLQNFELILFYWIRIDLFIDKRSANIEYNWISLIVFIGSRHYASEFIGQRRIKYLNIQLFLFMLIVDNLEHWLIDIANVENYMFFDEINVLNWLLFFASMNHYTAKIFDEEFLDRWRFVFESIFELSVFNEFNYTLMALKPKNKIVLNMI